jgi:hypothetical protein
MPTSVSVPPPPPTFDDAPTLELTLFSAQEHPFKNHGAEVLHLDSRAAPVLTTEQIVRLRDGNLYQLEELRKISKKWVVFRCDQCNDKGEVVKEGTSVLFAVEPEFVRRDWWNRLGRKWFEACPKIFCTK